MYRCDACGAPLKKAPFSSTLFQNRYICEGNTQHAFAFETVTGKWVRIAPAATASIVAALLVTKVITVLTDLDG